jgi:uncharacterized protein (DUF305 family)
MILRRTAILLAACLAALPGAACSSAATSSGAPPAAATSAEELAALEALFRERLEAARGRFVDADVAFMNDMIAHHAQALVMAEMAAERGASPAVQTLAARIINGQMDEIALMQQWLRERGQPVPEVRRGAGHEAHHDVAMPGMLTPERLAELERARGREFDRLFLIHMIEHHRGAVVMVDALLAVDGAAQDPAVFGLVADIKADQTTEIARMQRMLAAMFGGGTP